jgi:hypothetical protein
VSSLNTVSVLMFDGGDVVSRGVRVNILLRGVGEEWQEGFIFITDDRFKGRLRGFLVYNMLKP